ncbi:hypothetical protein SNEBB_007313 [Seison nebaliae]|nr:hypothetical protein SNEBB_007313 [Seison nebaliae]
MTVTSLQSNSPNSNAHKLTLSKKFQKWNNRLGVKGRVGRLRSMRNAPGVGGIYDKRLKDNKLTDLQSLVEKSRTEPNTDKWLDNNIKMRSDYRYVCNKALNKVPKDQQFSKNLRDKASSGKKRSLTPKSNQKPPTSKSKSVRSNSKRSRPTKTSNKKSRTVSRPKFRSKSTPKKKSTVSSVNKPVSSKPSIKSSKKRGSSKAPSKASRKSPKKRGSSKVPSKSSKKSSKKPRIRSQGANIKNSTKASGQTVPKSSVLGKPPTGDKQKLSKSDNEKTRPDIGKDEKALLEAKSADIAKEIDKEPLKKPDLTAVTISFARPKTGCPKNLICRCKPII